VIILLIDLLYLLVAIPHLLQLSLLPPHSRLELVLRNLSIYAAMLLDILRKEVIFTI
jgi:hypothetical protein